MVRLVGGTGLVSFPLCPGSGNPCAGAFWHAPTSRNLLQECMDTCRDAERASRRSTLPCAPVVDGPLLMDEWGHSRSGTWPKSRKLAASVCLAGGFVGSRDGSRDHLLIHARTGGTF